MRTITEEEAKRPIPNLSNMEEYCLPACKPIEVCPICGWIATHRSGNERISYPPFWLNHPKTDRFKKSICDWCRDKTEREQTRGFV
jgi:hypothetical protein